MDADDDADDVAEQSSGERCTVGLGCELRIDRRSWRRDTLRRGMIILIWDHPAARAS